MKSILFGLLFSLSVFSLSVFAHNQVLDSQQRKPVLADLQLLQLAGIPALYSDPMTGVAYTVLTADMEMKLSNAAHAF
jgi:hypothetical protein